MANCCDPIEIPTNCTNTCYQLTDANCVVDDASGYSCIGTGENATQHEINTAINSVLCELVQATIPCPSFTALTFSIAQPLVWTNFGLSRQVAQYSTAQNCTVRLRGVIKTTISSGAAAVNSLVTTLPAGYRPASVRSFSVNVRLIDGSSSTRFYPGFVTIAPDGTVYIDFINNIAGDFPWEVSFSFDSIFFEVSPL